MKKKLEKKITKTTKSRRKKHYKINYFNVCRLLFWVSIYVLLIWNILNQTNLIIKFNYVNKEIEAIKNAVDYNDTINLR